jgi:SAM-dependent methyltransferase
VSGYGWPVAVLSSDVDWASDDCIAELYELAAGHGIKPVFFVTHPSALLAELAAAGKVELALHPNFMPGSSHGADPAAVIEHVAALAPAARGFRSHGFVDSSDIARRFAQRGFTWDSNLCLYLQEDLAPLRHASGLTRFPVFWEDDVHMERASGNWDVDRVMEPFLASGLKVLDVHPVHYALNTPTMAFYGAHRAGVGALTRADLARLRHPGAGTRSFVDELIRRLKRADVRFATFSELLALQPSAGDPAGRTDRLTARDHERYWTSGAEERQAMLRALYNERDPADPYATSRDHNQRELEIFAIARAVSQRPPRQIIDLGCGNGWTLISLARQLPATRLVGIDFAERLIGGAHVLTERYRGDLKTIPEFLCEDAIAHIERLQPGSVDCILTERFLLNLPEEATQHRVLRAIERALAPGGRLLMCEGSLEGFHGLNDLRVALGIEAIAETSAENVSSRRFDDAAIERFVVAELGFRLVEKDGFSDFFAISRALYPALIAPQRPQFGARINELARRVQENRPLRTGLGSNVLWVLEKPAGD